MAVCRRTGRAVNANFGLNQFQVTAAAREAPEQAAPVVLMHPVASFSQSSHGGWPITAVLDGDPKTGWSIDPYEGHPHAAVFETQSPVGFPGGTVLTFTLAEGQPAGHNLGKLRLSVTTAKPPLPAPQTYGPPPMVVRGELPATKRGGMLVVTVEMKSGSNPAWLRNVGAHFFGEGKLAGERATFQPVLGQRTYPAPWQAWRTVAEPSAAPRAFELRMDTTVPPNAEWQYKGFFLPNP